jgi:hypothetical protein
MLEERGARGVLVSPTALRLRKGALFARGERLGALYRYFPAEYMQGQGNLAEVVAAVRSGAVRTLTSFAHIYAQSKLAFSRAWARAASLDDEARAAVGAYVPETRDLADVPRESLENERAEWVVKRAYGRVGDEVVVGALLGDDEWRALVRGALELRARGESWIAQRYVRQRAIATPWGPMFVTLGAYVLDGRFAGYFARITKTTHVSHDALCVPVFTEPFTEHAA